MDLNDRIKDDAWVDGQLSRLEPRDAWQPDSARALDLLRRRRASRPRRRWTGVAVAAVVAGSAVLAFPAPRAFAQRCVDVCGSEVLRAHNALFEAIADSHVHRVMYSHFVALRDLLLPSGVETVRTQRPAAPDFTLSDAAGRPVSLASFRGKVVLLNFWATWCRPCLEETPWFVEFQEKYRDRNFVVLGVSADEEGWSKVRPFVDGHYVNYLVVLGNEDVMQRYGVKSLPETLLIDERGRIGSRFQGLMGKAEYQREIEGFLDRGQ